MKRSRAMLLAAAILLLTALAMSQSAGYRLIDSVKLGGEGGWDYLTVDPEAQRVYVSRSTHVQVVDLAKHEVMGEIANTQGVHGIALAFGRGFTSNGRDSSVTVFDLSTLKSVATIRIDARNPDAILFDPYSGRVFTFNGRSADATAIDARTLEVAGKVVLPGKPEAAVSDLRGRIFVNIEDKSLLVVFDAKTLKVLDTWPLSPGEEPSGLALDRKNGRLFSVCHNRMMVVLDAATGKILATPEIGQGVDGAAYDAQRHLAFSSNGEGTLTVVREESPEKFSVLQNVPTRRGARTVALDEKTGRLYTVSARFGPPPPPSAERPHGRPSIEPGSATLYIIGH